VASPIGGWLYGVEPRLAFWTSAALMGAALVATVLAAAALRPQALTGPRPAPSVAPGPEEPASKAA